MDEKSIKVFGVPLADDRRNSPDHFFYYCTDMFYVSTYKPKKNYNVPKVFTVNGEYGPALTMKQCKEGLPSHFEHLVNGTIVNLKKVKEIVKIPHGAQVVFNVPVEPLEISDYAFDSKPWDKLIEEAAVKPADERWLPAVEYDESIKQGDPSLIRIEDVVVIESCSPKANYYVPMYKTEFTTYVEAMTLQSYKPLFPKLFPLLNTNLVNLDQVDSATDMLFDIVVRFKNSSLTTSMAHKYKKHFPEFFKK
ncbi:hypothetical protein P4H27_25740 [Paenibacillus taichungensis]|uniref:hypothetical protein n=1 Tax=Paenibacillus taichungensis TaxID=484184 RepID=UPI002DBB439C|nr:hypothetical protein [Paenibacillus taichungensis]MEC0110376.1 hypothetical protein [Paenibacillus taichungensis]MEC0200052.1 hypothetical protein [Paenibacillus taichungensis]